MKLAESFLAGDPVTEPAASASRSWFTWIRRRLGQTEPGQPPWRMERAFPRKRCAGWPAIAASWPSGGDGEALNIGRRARSIPPAIRRALMLRDRGCAFPGCTHTAFLHGHHIEHWLHGGETSLDNLVMLCTLPSSPGSRRRVDRNLRIRRRSCLPLTERQASRTRFAAGAG